MKYSFLSLALFLCLSFAFAQSTSATISGGVTDPAGNFIVNAEVEIVNDATGVIYSASTNSSGMYLVPILPPGRYHVQVSKPGFKTIIKSDVVLNVQSALALNFALPVGATSESVTVDAASSGINTTDASVSTVVDHKFVENIPLNGRSFQDLISMTPGVVTQSPQASSAIGYNGDFSVNGQRTESNYYTVDGVSGNLSAGSPLNAAQAANSGSVPTSTILGTTQALISVDALQEFRVQSSTYSAEYGRTPGGQFSLATRSGTNMLHGTLYDYLRNNYFDANDWFNDYYGQPIAALRQNDFGGAVSGPIVIPHIYNGIRRSFFFISYEGLRLVQPQAATVQYVPDTFMRQQAPTALRGILNAFPVQNGRDYGTAANPSLAEFIQSYSLPGQIDSTSIRLDHTVNRKLVLFFRFADTPSSTLTRTLSSVIENRMSTQTFTAGATSQLSNTINNEFRLGYASSDSSQSGSLDSFGGAIPTDIVSAMGLSGYAHPYPYFALIYTGIGGSDLGLNDGLLELRQWNLVDTMTWSKGRHQIKFGVDYRRILAPSSRANPFAAAYYYSTPAVLSNSATSASVSKYNPFTSVVNETASFVQDDWRLSSRLSLSVGLRWEINPPPAEANGNAPYTLLGDISEPSTLELAPRGTPLWKTAWYNFAPRIGAAWTAGGTPGRETVLRAGGGVFFDTDNTVATGGFASVGFATSKTFAGSALPFTASQLNFSPNANPPYTSTIVYAFPSHLQLPYTLQWNVSLEQALGKSQAFTVSYVGANGRRLLQRQIISVAASNPLFGYIAYFPNGVSSNYQALQLQFQRTLEHGLQALASYTWSHSIDFGSSYSSLPLLRGSSDFDVRSNLSGGVSWDIPGPNESRPLKLIFSHWSSDLRLMARTGFPVFLYGNYLTDPTTGSLYYANVNYDPSKPIYLYGARYPGGRALNGGSDASNPAFTLPSGAGTGNAPRNFVRGFGAWQANFAVRREFRPADKLRVQFRAEAFNILNHPNFGYIQPYLTSANFGVATAMLNQSLGTVASQYQQGGPRSMQFALKLIF